MLMCDFPTFRYGTAVTWSDAFMAFRSYMLESSMEELVEILPASDNKHYPLLRGVRRIRWRTKADLARQLMVGRNIRINTTAAPTDHQSPTSFSRSRFAIDPERDTQDEGLPVEQLTPQQRAQLEDDAAWVLVGYLRRYRKRRLPPLGGPYSQPFQDLASKIMPKHCCSTSDKRYIMQLRGIMPHAINYLQKLHDRTRKLRFSIQEEMKRTNHAELDDLISKRALVKYVSPIRLTQRTNVKRFPS